jgi:hypothetical protein
MNEIKTRNGSILAPVIMGRCAKCSVCGKLILGGETAYSERVFLGNKVVLKPPMCRKCAESILESPH